MTIINAYAANQANGTLLFSSWPHIAHVRQYCLDTILR
jgi:hypothetical protein